jgi:CBS domain-containing protein
MSDKKKADDSRPFSSRWLLEIRVKEVMNRGPRTVRPETSLDGLLERLLGQIEGCFPVVDKNQRLVGIVTESDVLQVLHPMVPQKIVGSVVRAAMKSAASTVGEIMTKRPVTVNPSMTIEEALNLMAAHKLRRLPVVEGEKLVGLLSFRDIIKLYRVVK